MNANGRNHGGAGRTIGQIYAEGQDRTCPNTGLPCLPTCTRRVCAGLNTPLNEWPTINRDADQEAELIELSRSQRMGAAGGWGTRLGTQGAWLLNPEGKVAGYLTSPALAEDIARLLTNWNNAGGGQ